MPSWDSLIWCYTFVALPLFCQGQCYIQVASNQGASSLQPFSWFQLSTWRGTVGNTDPIVEGTFDRKVDPHGENYAWLPGSISDISDSQRYSWTIMNTIKLDTLRCFLNLLKALMWEDTSLETLNLLGTVKDTPFLASQVFGSGRRYPGNDSGQGLGAAGNELSLSVHKVATTNAAWDLKCKVLTALACPHFVQQAQALSLDAKVAQQLTKTWNPTHRMKDNMIQSIQHMNEHFATLDVLWLWWNSCNHTQSCCRKVFKTLMAKTHIRRWANSHRSNLGWSRKDSSEVYQTYSYGTLLWPRLFNDDIPLGKTWKHVCKFRCCRNKHLTASRVKALTLPIDRVCPGRCVCVCPPLKVFWTCWLFWLLIT